VCLPARRPASAGRPCSGTAEGSECGSARPGISAGDHAVGQQKVGGSVAACTPPSECMKVVLRDSRRVRGCCTVCIPPSECRRPCSGAAKVGGSVPACQAASKAKDLKPFSFTEKPNKIPPCLIQGAELLSQQATYTTKKLFSI